MKTIDLKQLALDIHAHKVFGTWQLRKMEDAPKVFLPLALGGAEKLPNNAGHLYEYYDKAGRGSINGMPMFLSYHILTLEQVEELQKLIDRLKEQEEKFLEEPTP